MRQSTRLDVLIKRPLSGLPSSERADRIPPRPGEQEPLFHSWQVMESADLRTQTTTVGIVVDNTDIYEFRRRVSALSDQVVALFVEEGEQGERHITTFISKASKVLENKIFQVEAEIISKYTNRIFDFHVRIVPQDDSGNPVLPGGTYYLLTWQV